MVEVGDHNQSDRELWLSNTLKKIPAGSRILDAGAGERQYKKMCAHLNYVSQDFAQYDGKGNSQGLQTETWDQSKLDIVSDITKIPEPDAAFDAIMCIEVLEHLPEPIKAIEEFHRLLKPGGYLILTAPFCSLTHFAPYHFYTGYNRYFYDKVLAEKGFNVTEMVENGNFFEYLAQEIRRIPYITEKYTDKKLNVIERLEIRFMLKTLGTLSGKDKGSGELLNFGIHVLATKG